MKPVELAERGNERNRLLSTVDSGLPVLLDVDNSMIGL